VQEDHGPEHEAPGDHEYDEAHDTVDAAHTEYVDAGPTGPAEAHIATGPIDEIGDYGYDMAHDVPR